MFGFMIPRYGLFFIGVFAIISVSFVLRLGTACADMFYFKKGFSYKSEKFVAGGIPAGHYTVTIDSVQDFGDSIVSFYTSDGVTSKGKNVRLQGSFSCSHGDLMIDPMSLSDLGDMNNHLSVQSSKPIRYPLELNIGDTLVPWNLYFTITEDWGGQVIFKLDGRSRKCIAIDSLNGFGEKVPTFVIESDISTKLRQGSNNKLQVTRTLEWFSPTYGVLKTETYTDSVLFRYNTVTLLKR